MKVHFLTKLVTRIIIVFSFINTIVLSHAQTNVYDNVLLVSPNHSTFATALQQTGLEVMLQDVTGTYTVFAPDNNAFINLSLKLGITVNDVLNLPELPAILEYHIANSVLQTTNLTNGLLLNVVNPTNTVKVSTTSLGTFFVNHATINNPDLLSDNGVVHSIDEIIFPEITVFDINESNGLSTLNALLFQAELVPSLTDPFSELTLFAPDNTAINELAASLGLNVTDLFNLPNLADLLKYHFLNYTYLQGNFTNGDLISPESIANTLKITKTSGGSVYVNHSKLVSINNLCDNGVVHIINKGLIPNSTVVDIIIGNNLTTLQSALFKAELVPTLIDPFLRFTVFAPTNVAFDTYATSIGITATDILNLPNLSDILQYHVLGGTLFSVDMVNGNYTTLNGQDLTLAINTSYLVNNATILTLDLLPSIGVVHIVDNLLQATAEVEEAGTSVANFYPNPVTDKLYIESDYLYYNLLDQTGRVISQDILINNFIDTSQIPAGTYLLQVVNEKGDRIIPIVKL